MSVDYSVNISKQLRDKAIKTGLHRPFDFGRYEVGDELGYQVRSILSGDTATVKIVVEKFVGGGFAGQVYRVIISEINIGGAVRDRIDDLAVGGVYAMKILIPPSGFSVMFRNLMYWIGFQGPFQLQVNPEAARAGAIWQKFIRRAAGVKFGSEGCVNNIHATFVDHDLGSCGEFSDWVQGRTWRLEVDENLDTLKRWKKNKPVDQSRLGSDEYRAKYKFMHDFVDLLHEVGAHEFARQYEWSTCKSQPNCLKRTDTDDDPKAGLMAVDFRAGLALLPFLPMSPGDFMLIAKGLKRGSLVQFDRGNLDTLEAYVNEHRDRFDDIIHLLDQLKAAEKVYRDSLPDITHNHIRLLYDVKLWGTILDGAVTGWRVKNLIDEKGEKKLRNSKFKTFLLCLVGMIPLFGRFVKKFGYHRQWRKHYTTMLTNFRYFRKAVKAKSVERVLGWYRAGRINEEKAEQLAGCLGCFAYFAVFAWQPAGIQKFMTDKKFRNDKLYFLFVRPFKLYFSNELREQWMLDMVAEGKKKHIVTEEDAETIVEQLKEPYIQRYLMSLVVHVMTLPVTQVVSVIVAWIFVVKHPDMDPAERSLRAGGILVLFQVIPVSPGSFCRGFYTTCLAIYERNFKDYNIALFLSYFKYVGYLAFPIQMTYRYPAMARFMAGHWATDAVHAVPVFGEHGALLEHWVFCLFYNWPLTIRRRISERVEKRKQLKPRLLHVPVLAATGAAIFVLANKYSLENFGQIAALKQFWYLTLFVPGISGALVTRFAGGLALWKRFVSATLCGLSIGFLGVFVTSFIVPEDVGLSVKDLIVSGIWRMFAFSIFATIGALITEICWKDGSINSKH